MTAFDHRLREVLKGLTARERAMLALRSWIAEEPFEPELLRSMPGEQRDEYNRLVLRYEDANTRVSGFVGLWQHWVVETELQVFWLFSLKAWEEREEIYKACLAEQGVAVRRPSSRRAKGKSLVLGPGPVCPWTLMKGMTPLGRTPMPDHWDEHPPRLLELSKALSQSVKGGIEQHWREQRAIEIVFAELSAEYEGEETLHPVLRLPVNECKAKLVELRESVLQWCGPFPLPEPTADLLTLLRETVFPEQREAREKAEAAATKAPAEGVEKS